MRLPDRFIPVNTFLACRRGFRLVIADKLTGRREDDVRADAREPWPDWLAHEILGAPKRAIDRCAATTDLYLIGVRGPRRQCRPRATVEEERPTHDWKDPRSDGPKDNVAGGRGDGERSLEMALF
jgi:hypothetical protein